MIVYGGQVFKLDLVMTSVIILGIVAGIAIYQKNSKNINNNITAIKMNEVTRSVFYAPQYVAINNGYFKDSD